MPKSLNKVEYPTEVMAAIFGVTKSRIRQLTKEGMPKSGRNSYPLVACIRWYVAYFRDKARDVSNQMAREKRRLLKTKADRGEFELGALKMEFLPAAEVKQVWTRHITAVKSKVLGIKSAVAPLVQDLISNPEDRENILALVDASAREALNELADSELPGERKK